MYKNEVDKLVEDVSRNLLLSANSYYKLGLSVFEETRAKAWTDFQPAIGNISISIELLLKGVVAQKAFRLLYTNLPDEASLLISYPEVLSEAHNSKSFISDLKTFTSKTIDLDKSVSLFFHLYPELKQEFRPFLTSLSTVRNVSVHAAIPNYQKYELDRIVYYSTKLFAEVANRSVFKFNLFKIPPKLNDFIKMYEDEKVKSVQSALDKARKNLKKSKPHVPMILGDDWTEMGENCPICESLGIMTGETEFNSPADLHFLAETFKCDHCGLELEDYEEIDLAGMESTLDRSDELQEWFADKEYYYPE
ncbi:TPA: hypothetical protein NJ503_004679 [Vibrio parahaemolyticus]|nr:hypothetical protein [Vibrio parahaemolyticus]HCG8180799.1 hypothetical protein [Vibrio parahaemolyticus]